VGTTTEIVMEEVGVAIVLQVATTAEEDTAGGGIEESKTHKYHLR